MRRRREKNLHCIFPSPDLQSLERNSSHVAYSVIYIALQHISNLISLGPQFCFLDDWADLRVAGRISKHEVVSQLFLMLTYLAYRCTLPERTRKAARIMYHANICKLLLGLFQKPTENSPT